MGEGSDGRREIHIHRPMFKEGRIHYIQMIFCFSQCFISVDILWNPSQYLPWILCHAEPLEFMQIWIKILAINYMTNVETLHLLLFKTIWRTMQHAAPKWCLHVERIKDKIKWPWLCWDFQPITAVPRPIIFLCSCKFCVGSSFVEMCE
jgi:hypothetical protein